MESSLIDLILINLSPIFFIILGILGVLGYNKIKYYYYAFTIKNSIAIFGPKCVGKTTLIKYLQKKALPRTPSWTKGASSVGKIAFELNNNGDYFFSNEMYDVGGEHKQQWKWIVNKQNPNGIIYIIDTLNQPIEIEGFIFLFTTYKEQLEKMPLTEIRLKSILILINKADLWGISEEKRRSILIDYQEKLAFQIRQFNEMFDKLDIVIQWTSLTDVDQNDHTNSILRQFGKILEEKGG
nr:ADP-ribosylation factor-like protein [uncultured Methanoregula sp.]